MNDNELTNEIIETVEKLNRLVYNAIHTNRLRVDLDIQTDNQMGLRDSVSNILIRVYRELPEDLKG